VRKKTDNTRIFESERIILRPLRITDAWDVYINIRDKEVSKYSIVAPPTCLDNPMGRLVCRLGRLIVKAVKLLCSRLHLPVGLKDRKLGIVLKGAGKVIGIASVENIDWMNKTASVGFWIGKRYWGRGIMKETMPLLINYCFGVLDIHRLWAEVHIENLASLRIFDRANFEREGLFRKDGAIAGRRVDVVRLRLLRSNWQSMKA
jgi:RimJ/RimL family protein N-acetyltransferase